MKIFIILLLNTNILLATDTKINTKTETTDACQEINDPILKLDTSIEEISQTLKKLTKEQHLEIIKTRNLLCTQISQERDLPQTHKIVTQEANKQINNKTISEIITLGKNIEKTLKQKYEEDTNFKFSFDKSQAWYQYKINQLPPEIKESFTEAFNFLQEEERLKEEDTQEILFERLRRKIRNKTVKEIIEMANTIKESKK